MTREETVTIIRAIKASYPTFKPDDLTETINVWYMMLEDQDYHVITMALKNYIRTNNSGFAPSIGQLMDHAHDISTPQELTGTEAWSLVMKAVRNSAYNSLKEFAKLPETVQKAVGSPEELASMAVDENFNEMVASSNFQRAYKVVCDRQKGIQKMPQEVQALFHEVNKDSPMKLLERSNKERVERLNASNLIESQEAEYVPMPEEARKKIREVLGYDD